MGSFQAQAQIWLIQGFQIFHVSLTPLVWVRQSKIRVSAIKKILTNMFAPINTTIFFSTKDILHPIRN